jgi:mannan endo-1,4-beta-mannosidase
MTKHGIFLMLSLLVLGACGARKSAPSESEFITVKDGQFIRHGKPYYYVGTNFWHAPILASEGEGGNRELLGQELDFLQSIGVTNLRVLVGAQGEPGGGVKARVEPVLQTGPGEYNDTLLAGLDYLMSELDRRDMTAVLYLNNSWEWSGGYGLYLQWSGHGKAPVPATDGWPAYMEYVQQYAQSDSAQALFNQHVRFILSRENRYTHRPYTEDPAILSWQIGNEPRAFSDDNKEAFAQWMARTSLLIKSLDHNHLVSTGSEGKHGCEQDIDLCERIHADSNIDYVNFHLWPYNWSWAKEDSLTENLPRVEANTKAYIDLHLAIAEKLNKPAVMEEFGYPRDGFQFDKNSPTTARDAFYRYVFQLVADNALKGGKFAGVNFWAWGGLANPQHTYWEKGDDYTGDPAQEQQGLNSVFAADSSTISLIKEMNAKFEN